MVLCKINVEKNHPNPQMYNRERVYVKNEHYVRKLVLWCPEVRNNFNSRRGSRTFFQGVRTFDLKIPSEKNKREAG